MENNYPNYLIEKVIRECGKQNSHNCVPKTKPFEVRASTVSCTLPYIRGITDKIGNILRRHEIQTVFRPSIQVRNFHSRLKDRRPKTSQSGVVYKINCDKKKCDQHYVGQTSQRLKDRVSQHRLAVTRNRPERSALAEHMIESQHYDIDWENPEILHHESDWKKRLFKERWEIAQTKEFNVNRTEDMSGFPDIYRVFFGD